jgi:hypothetical protein
VDGFTSDAIPIHLLTLEAFEAYTRALAPGGLIVVHISNRHVGLEPVLKGIAERMGVTPLIGAGTSRDNVPSVWVVLSTEAARLDRLRERGWIDLGGRSELWTDQRSSLVSLLLDPGPSQGDG